MRLITGLAAISLLHASSVFAAANCQHSSSWQCQGHQGQTNQGSQTGTGISTGGQTPNQGQTNPHLGTGTTNTVPMMTLQPAMAVPTKVQVVVPPQAQVVAPPKIPVLAPPKVPPQAQVVAPPKSPVLVPPRARVVAPPKTPVLAPPKVPPQAQVVTPPKTPVLVPPKVPPQGQVVAPPLVPPRARVVAPPKTPVLVPPQAPPKKSVLVPGLMTQQVPQNVPPQVQVVAPPKAPVLAPALAPAQQVYPNPRPIIVGTAPAQLPGNGSAATTSGAAQAQPSHLLVNNRAGLFAGGQQLPKTDYGNEVVEPGIMNSKVALYRSHDVRESLFKDTMPMDATGFHLTFAGIKEPVFTSPTRLVPEIQPASEMQPAAQQEATAESQPQPGEWTKSFVFFFDFASTALHPDQVGLLDEVAAEYEATGNRLTLISETDGFGSLAYNRILANHRSDAVLGELQNRGIDAEDIETHLVVRHGRSDPSTDDSHRNSSIERIVWVLFE